MTAIRPAISVLVLVVIGSLSACAPAVTTPSPTPIPTPRPTASGDVGPLVLYPATLEGMDALIEAAVILDDGCLYLADRGFRWLAVWPWPITTWEEDAVTVDGVRVPIGSRASFGGGELELNAGLVANVDWVVPPDPRCQATKVWRIQGAELLP